MSAQRWAALATDYDGTIACEGVVDDLTLAALQRARRAGIRLVLVTGRELSDLANTFPHTGLFDRIVAENGAVIEDPATKSLQTLALAPPPELLAELAAQSVPFSVGHSIVATVEPHETALVAIIRRLGLDWRVIRNKGSIMALPSGVSKATGLEAVCTELRIAPAQLAGIGDAENDIVFLRVCGLPVAVANALPCVKQVAAMSTEGAHGAGVVELIEQLLSPAV